MSLMEEKLSEIKQLENHVMLLAVALDIAIEKLVDELPTLRGCPAFDGEECQQGGGCELDTKYKCWRKLFIADAKEWIAKQEEES